MALIGFLVGYQFFALLLYLNDLLNFINPAIIPELSVKLLGSALFGIIFFILAPRIKKTCLKIVEAFEKEILKFSTMDIMLGALGLIIGFVIAFLISQPFSHIKYWNNNIHYTLLGLWILRNKDCHQQNG